MHPGSNSWSLEEPVHFVKSVQTSFNHRQLFQHIYEAKLNQNILNKEFFSKINFILKCRMQELRPFPVNQNGWSIVLQYTETSSQHWFCFHNEVNITYRLPLKWELDTQECRQCEHMPVQHCKQISVTKNCVIMRLVCIWNCNLAR
jgi:hypothetical protein